MAARWNPWILSLLPGLVSGLVWVGDTAVLPYANGECDPKFGCLGWIQVACFIAALSSLLSAVGISAGALRYREVVRRLSIRQVLVLLFVLTLLVLTMLYTIGQWPVGSFAIYLCLWLAITFAVTCILLMLFRRLTSNTSFRVPPTSGAPQPDR